MKYLKIIVPLLILLGYIVFTNGNTDANDNITQADTLFNPQYYNLKKKLDQYETIKNNGAWQRIIIKNNDSLSAQEQILLIRRLVKSEDIKDDDTLKGFNADILSGGLLNFQIRHGLEANGKLNSTTVDELNISVEERIEQIKINLERWKAIPPNLDNYILVNIPDYKLNVIENDTIVLRMKVIVGKIYRSTPTFNASMTHIIFNPEWIIPPTILKYDVLPLIKKDTSYLRKERIHVMERTVGKDKKEIPIDSINWKTINANNFPYDLVKEPGPGNPMGKVKFIFPNKYNIYFHDTPSKLLFNQEELTLSSGCIRLSDAKILAIYILKKQGISAQKTEKILSSETTTRINIKKNLPVYIQYFTSWIDENGTIHFRRDIYNKDISP